MIEMVKFPYNNKSIARIDSNNIVHNHMYHNCPIGKVDKNNLIYDINDNVVGRVDENGNIYSSNSSDNLIGNIKENGFVFKDDVSIGKVKPSNLAAGAAYLLLIHENR